MEKIKLTEEEKNRISILHKINLSEDFKINFEIQCPIPAWPEHSWV